MAINKINKVIKGADGAFNTNDIATGKITQTVLTTGVIYDAVVTAYDEISKKYTVTAGGNVMDAYNAIGLLSSMIGFTINTNLQIGTPVQIIMGKPATIIAVSRSHIHTEGKKPYSMTGYGYLSRRESESHKSELEEGPIPSGVDFPDDAYEGELVIDNNMGIMLRLLQNMAALSAGDLAKVECCLLNEMVRIVDNCFVHHSAGASTLMYNAGGRTSVEEHFTSYGFEADGKVEPNDELISISDGAVNWESMKDAINQDGRWRGTLYKGFLGDLIHTIVTDPTSIKGAYSADAARAGKSRVWQAANGTILLESVNDIIIQKVPRVVVPILNSKWDDPEMDIHKIMGELNSRFLKAWGTGPDYRDLRTACYQLRSYSRYVSQWLSMARFRQLADKDKATIPTEAKSPEPSYTNKEQDVEEANPSQVNGIVENYSTIGLFKDGSIVLRDGYGSSIVMNQGNVQISAAGNLDLQAAGNVTVTSKNIFAKASDSIELAAIGGAFIAKARSYFNVLCELGRVLIKSDASEGGEVGNPVYDGANPPPVEVGSCGIILDAPNSKTLVHGDQGVIVDANEDVIIQSRQANVVVFALQQVKAICLMLLVKAGAKVGITSPVVAMDTQLCTIGKSCKITNNTANFSNVMAKSVTSSSGYVGPSKYVSESENIPNPDFDDGGATGDSSGLSNSAPFDTASEMNYTWEFLDEEYYNTQSDDIPWADWKPIRATLFFDKLQNDEDTDGYSKWQQTSNTTLTNTRTGNTAPYPGRNGQHLVYTQDTENIDDVWEKEVDSNIISTGNKMQLQQLSYFIRL